MKNKYKIILGAKAESTIIDNVIDFIIDNTDINMDFESLEKEIIEMEVEDIILIKGIAIQRIN